VTLQAAAAAASEPSCYSRLTNDWFCAQYVRDYQQEITDATIQHLGITIAAVVLGVLIAFPLALVARRLPRLETGILGAATAIYTIPSLALYALTVLVRSMLEGLRSVPSGVRESASGMGYGATRLLFLVELPLALPVIMAGLRVATVSTVALTTVGSLVAYGGLGNLIKDGVTSNFRAELMTASILCVLIAVLFDVLIVFAQWLLTPWTRGVRA